MRVILLPLLVIRILASPCSNENSTVRCFNIFKELQLPEENRTWHRLIVSDSEIEDLSLPELPECEEIQLSGIALKRLKLSAGALTQLDLNTNNVERIQGFAPKLHTLVLAHNNLKTSEVFTDFHTLVVLDLSFNALVGLPRSLNRSQLQVLNVSHNKLQVLDLAFFIQARRLQVLNLSSNRLTVLAPIFYTLRALRVLVIDDNDIVEINAELFQNTALAELYVERNRFSCGQHISMLREFTFRNVTVFDQSFDFDACESQSLEQSPSDLSKSVSELLIVIVVLFVVMTLIGVFWSIVIVKFYHKIFVNEEMFFCTANV